MGHHLNLTAKKIPMFIYKQHKFVPFSLIKYSFVATLSLDRVLSMPNCLRLFLSKFLMRVILRQFPKQLKFLIRWKIKTQE